MTSRWAGIVVSGAKVTLVDVEAPSEGPLVLHSDQTWPLQEGARPGAYRVMHQRVADYVRENGIKRIIVKASAVAQRGAGKAHLDSAELRGVVMCAAASVGPVELWSKGAASRRLVRKGKRKVDEYIQDHEYFAAHIEGTLKAGSREAALMLVAARGE
jgi:hypothetical protein